MGMQNDSSDSYCNKHHHEYSKSLFHIIKHHPLCHFIQKRHKKNETVLAQRDEAFSCDQKKNLSLVKLTNSNVGSHHLVEEKVTPHSSEGKNTERSQTKASPLFFQSTHDLEQSIIDPFSETILTINESYRIKRCVQCDATSSSGNLGCKHHQPAKNELLARQVTNKKKCKVEDNARKHTYGASTNFYKKLFGALQTNNMNKELLLTFLHDPVSPMIYHFHKQHVQRSKPKGRRRLYCDNENQKLVQFESSKEFFEQAMPLVAKAKVNGNFDMNEAVIIVRDRNFSLGSSKGQHQKELKHIKSLKQKIEYVTGESEKEKIRVAMDSVIHKLPQGQGISDELKKEILKKLTDPIITKEAQNKSSIRRIKSLQEQLENYCQQQEKPHSPLKMLIPFQRILSLPDLQSFSYTSQNEEISNVHSKSQQHLDKLVEDLIQENFVSIDENDLVIRNIVKSGSNCVSRINGKVDLLIDDFGHSSLKNCGTFNDQYIESIKEYKAAIAASDSKSKSGLAGRLDNVVEQQENVQKMEILTQKLNDEIPHIHVDTKYQDEFNYVKYVLEISGLSSNGSISAWHSSDTPLDPSLYEEMENDPDFCGNKGGHCNHHALFDLINESMLEIFGRSHCYPPIGCHILHKVWNHMSKSLSLRSKVGQKIDDYVSRDLSKNDGWVNFQFYGEGVGLEVEDKIFLDLLEEIMLDLVCL